jgi:rubredoxin
MLKANRHLQHNAARNLFFMKHQEEARMDRYVCTVYGYVYDPAIGDPDSGVKPGHQLQCVFDCGQQDCID